MKFRIKISYIEWGKYIVFINQSEKKIVTLNWLFQNIAFNIWESTGEAVLRNVLPLPLLKGLSFSSVQSHSRSLYAPLCYKTVVATQLSGIHHFYFKNIVMRWQDIVPLLTSYMLSKLQLITYGTEVMKLDSTLRQDEHDTEDDSNMVADIRHLVHYDKT